MFRVFLILLALLMPVFCFGMPYWPSPPDGTIYHYLSPDNQQLNVRYSQVGNLQHREYIYEDQDRNGGEYYEITDELVRLTGYYSTLPGEGSTIINYTPSFSISKIGLQFGMNWRWQGTCDYGAATVIGHVSRGASSSPFWSNDVLRINYYESDATCTLPYIEVYLHPEFGPIQMDDWVLVAIGSVVVNESASWDCIKSLYK